MISFFELFKVGLGPSSSHTTGPMKAAGYFQEALAQYPSVDRIQVTLFGSLAWTGKGHATEKAIVLGLMGCRPETIEPEEAEVRFIQVRTTRQLPLGGKTTISFDLEHDIVFDLEHILPDHSNAMTFAAFDGGSRAAVLVRIT